MIVSDNEIWLNRRGQSIESFAKSHGRSALTSPDRLIEVVWSISCSMRRHGDLTAARSSDPGYVQDGLTLAHALGLGVAIELFSSSEGGLERNFFALFDDLCAELRRL